MKWREFFRSVAGTALALLFSTAIVPLPARGDVKLPALFSDHTVLQRDALLPIWGWAAPDEAVTVAFAGQQKSAIADASGKWSVRLDKLPANVNPQTLTVTGKNTLVVSDVLVGDVWLCSGQSNMTYRLGYNKDFHAAAIAEANDPGLRCFTVDYQTAPAPLEQLVPSPWQSWDLATPDNVEHNFPAVGYFFGKELRQQLGDGVPIGLMHASYGATPAEAWVSRAALNADPELKAMADKQIANMESYPANTKLFAQNVAAWEAKYNARDVGNTGEAQGWTKPDFDDSTWKTVAVPMNFSQIEMKAGGAVWLRKTFAVPTTAAGKWLFFKLNYSTDDYTLYFNGVPVKSNEDTPQFFNEARSFNIPGNLVQEGRNTFAVRVFSHSKNGSLPLKLQELGVPLGPAANEWRYAVEFTNPELPPNSLNDFPRAPYAVPQYTANYLFNAMISPLIPTSIKGVIWYQGESNTSRAIQYRKLLPTLISDWRTRWAAPEMPFYIVQLANYGAPVAEPQDSGWAELREAQFLTATHDKASGLAVAIDIGEAKDIHPKNKLDVGKRLALNALAKTYGRVIEYQGPLYERSTIEGSAIRIKFGHTGGGLVAKGGPLKQFAIAGEDKKFVWADAHIDDSTVVVSNPQVTHPAAVRYAWGDNPEGCNLYNGADLPASPFRTDDWPGITINNH